MSKRNLKNRKLHNGLIGCGASNRQFAALDKDVDCGHCLRLFKKSKRTTETNCTAQVVEKKRLVNHVALVIDSSGSMSRLSTTLVAQVNAQLDEIKRTARESGQETYVSLYTFSHTQKVHFTEILAQQVGVFRYYTASGSTALYDAVIKVINDLDAVRVANNVNSSNLVIVLTDGYENSSDCTEKTFQDIVAGKTATDKWSFVFLCPYGYKVVLVSKGILPGNVQEWEQSEWGLQKASGQTQTAYRAYSTLRSTGAGSTQSSFSPDLSGVTGAKLARKLQDVSKDFLRLHVFHDIRIDDFVLAATGQNYVKGSGYYQLTKKEKAVQVYKELIVQDTRTNELYRGARECRELLGLPVGGTIELHPASHPTYKVFVNSTSFNRRLVSDTTLLLDKSLI